MSDDAIAVIRRITDIDTTVNKLTDSITDLHEFIEEVKTEVKDFVDQLRTEEIKIYTSMARYRNIILRMQLTLAQNELTLQKNINSSTKTIKLHYRNRKEDAGEETTYSASISQQSRFPHCIDESSTSDSQNHIDDDDIKKIFSGLKQQLLPYKKRLAKLDHEFRLFRDGTNPEDVFATFDNKDVETQTESCACSTVKVTRSTSTQKYESKSSSSSDTSKISKDDKKAKHESMDPKAQKSYNQKEPSNQNNQQERALNQRHDKHLQEETFNQKGNQALVVSKRSITEARNNDSTKDSSSQNNNNSERECHASEKESNKLKEKKHSSHVDALKDSIELEKRDGRESPKLIDIHKAEISQEVSQKKSNESNHSKTSKPSKSHKEHSQKQIQQQKDTSNNVSQKKSKKPKDHKQSNNLNASKDCESHRHHSRKGSPSLKDSQKEGSFLRFTQKEPDKKNGNNELDTTKISNPKGSNLTDAQKKDSSHKKDREDASLLENNHLETSKTCELLENQSRKDYSNLTDTQKKDNSQKASQKESNKMNNKNKVSNNQGSSEASDNNNNNNHKKNSLKESSKLSDSKKKETSQKENNKPRYNKATHGESSRASECLSNHNKKVFSKLKDTQNDEVSLKQAQIVPSKPMDKKQVSNLNVPKDPKNQEKHVLIESSTHISKKIKVISQTVIQKDPPKLMDNEDSTHTWKYSYQQHNLGEPPKLTDCHNDTSKKIQSELTKANNNKTEISNSIKPANCFTYEIVKQENIDETIININDSDIDSDSTLILEEKYTISPTELLVSESVDIKPNLLPVKCESIQGSSNNQNDTDNTKTLQRHNDPKLTTKVPVVILENMKLPGAKSKPKDPEKNVTSLESNKVNNNEENKLAKVPIVRLQYQDFIRKYKERLAKDYNINVPTSTSNQNLAPENNSQSTTDNKLNNTSNNNPSNKTTSQSRSTEVKPNNSRRKRRRSGRSNNRACKKLKTDNTVSSTQQSTITNQSQSTITNQSQSTITNQSQSTITNQSQSTITNQSQSTITNQSQSTITNQPQSTITNQSQSTITNQSQSTITNQSQSTITNQLQSTITSQLQSTIAPGLITYIPVINLDAIALHYQLRQNFSNGFNSLDQTDLVSYLPPRDLLEPVKSTYKLNVDDITKSSNSSEHLPVNPIYKFIGEDTKKKPNTTFKYHAVNEKVSCLPDVRDNRFIFNDEVRSIHATKDKPRQYNDASQIFNGANEKANITSFDKEIEHIYIPKVFDNNQANKQSINPEVKCAVNNNVVLRDPRGYSQGTEGYRKPYETIYTPGNLDHYNKKNGNI